MITIAEAKQQDKIKLNIPPEEIINDKDFEHIILWMLSNNDHCSWSDFTQDIEEDNQLISDSTLSLYLKRLRNKNYIERPERDHYIILPQGKKRFIELSKMKKKEKSLNYPPKVIKKERNYDHWILWMLYNNNSCKWSDFTEEPLRINQSSLSKNLNILIDSGFIRRENKKYKITQKGKIQYSQMLRNYDLDRQSILEEESKRIDEIIQNTRPFFNLYNVSDRDVKYRFLNYNLKMNYTKFNELLSKEEFLKILLFIATNHPDSYPDYISLERFSKNFKIEEKKLDYWVSEIISKDLFPIKFFTLTLDDGKKFYFASGGKIERILRSIVDDYIYKFTYLRKLDEHYSYDIHDLVESILNDACGNAIHADLKPALHEFLANTYLKHLTYEIETKKQLINISDKLEGYSYQKIQGLFQQNDILYDHYKSNSNQAFYLYPEVLKVLASSYKKEIKSVFEQCESLLENRETTVEDILKIIDTEIEKSPNILPKYILKATYLSVYLRNEEALSVLEEDINQNIDMKQLKKKQNLYVPIISVLKCYSNLSMGRIENAMEINEELTEEYPDHPFTNLEKALIYGYNTVYKWISEPSSLEIFLKNVNQAITSDDNILNKSRYHQLKANIMFLLEDFENGFDAIDSAIALKDNILDYYYNKIHGLTMDERFEEAFDLIDEALTKFPNKKKILENKKVHVHFKKAEKVDDLTIIDDAIELLIDLNKKYPKDYNILNTLAYGYAYRKNETKATETLQKLISLEPINGNFYDSFGEILQMFEKYNEAIEKYKKAIEINPNGFYLYQTYPRLGMCYYHLGEYDLAKQYFEQGLETISSGCCENEKKDFWDNKAREYLHKIETLD